MLAADPAFAPRAAQRACFLLLLLALFALLGAPAPAPLPPPLRASGAGAGAIELVQARHGARFTAASWAAGGGAAGGGAPRAAPPVFFLTAARAWGGGGKLQAARDEQYAANVGNILALGFPVYVSVSPSPEAEAAAAAAGGGGGGGDGFPLLEELAAAAPPGQLRLHYCSQATAVRRRSGGADELLCMQEAIPALFAGCVLPVEPWAPLTPAPPGCPAGDTHVIRMSGRYLMARPDVLRAVHARGEAVDAFFKWNANWTESNPIAKTLDPAWEPLNLRQVMTFMLSMKVRARLCRAPFAMRRTARSPLTTPAPPPLFPPPPPPLPPPPCLQLRHFIDCHMMRMGVAGGWDSASRSVWRFAIEKLTADCILALPATQELEYLGVVGNVGNSASYVYY